jgi:hypothetical protein
MFRAIVTKFKGPTENNGSRVIATVGNQRHTHHWDYGAGNGTIHSDVDANHNAAARALAIKLGWCGTWIGGGMPDNTGNVYIRLSRGDTVADKTSIAFVVSIEDEK